ncbi:MAG TPA: hypothetical protein VHN11_21015 [Xanthobacteraceae bacterium]|jgi:hypothetical protein|nr:hypothetical protein [Xanthobacteraceae bacterium]
MNAPKPTTTPLRHLSPETLAACRKVAAFAELREQVESPARPATLSEKDAALTRAQLVLSETLGYLQELTAGTRSTRAADAISEIHSTLTQIKEAL